MGTKITSLNQEYISLKDEPIVSILSAAQNVVHKETLVSFLESFMDFIEFNFDGVEPSKQPAKFNRAIIEEFLNEYNRNNGNKEV